MARPEEAVSTREQPYAGRAGLGEEFAGWEYEGTWPEK
jgi:hypothetical protein